MADFNNKFLSNHNVPSVIIFIITIVRHLGRSNLDAGRSKRSQKSTGIVLLIKMTNLQCIYKLVAIFAASGNIIFFFSSCDSLTTPLMEEFLL